LTDSQ